LPPQPEFEAQSRPEQSGNPRSAGQQCKLPLTTSSAARAGYLPSITLDYFLWKDAPQYAVNGPFVDGSHVPNLGSSYIASLSLPVWNWGAPKAASARRAATHASQARTLLCPAQAPRRNALLYSEAETALNELAGLQRSAELSEESLRLTTMRYQGGEATVLEVVDAQTTFAQANAAYQDGAVRYRVALANLQTLTGVLTTP